jgi:hypothetical protein
MRTLLQTFKWGGIPVSFILWAIGIYQTAEEAAQWLLPTWLWLLLGVVIITACSFSIIYGLWRENRTLRRKPEIDLIYNERSQPCRDTVVATATIGEEETEYAITKTVYRVGVRVLGDTPVEGVEVLPLSLRRTSDEEQPQLAASLPLRPMHISDSSEQHKFTVNPGQVPAYYVDVFEHVSRSSTIQLCYHSVRNRKALRLAPGEYNYFLIARSANARESIRTLKLALAADGNLLVSMVNLKGD